MPSAAAYAILFADAAAAMLLLFRFIFRRRDVTLITRRHARRCAQRYA